MYEKSYVKGRVTLTVWKNTKPDTDEEYYNYTIQKSYKDKITGEWKNTNNLNDSDLPNVAVLVSMIQNKAIKERGSTSETPQNE